MYGGKPRDLHSFPTRRSSDLGEWRREGAVLRLWTLKEAYAKARGMGLGIGLLERPQPDRKSTRLNSSHVKSSYAVFCLKKEEREGDFLGDGWDKTLSLW